MTLRVVVTLHAERQLLEQALWWSEHRSAEQAWEWLEGFDKRLQNLAKEPGLYSLARENNSFERELREFYYGLGKKVTHRAIFEILGTDVIVHSIRHLAQQDISAEDL